jgi:hypothetical protein
MSSAYSSRLGVVFRECNGNQRLWGESSSGTGIMHTVSTSELQPLWIEVRDLFWTFRRAFELHTLAIGEYDSTPLVNATGAYFRHTRGLSEPRVQSFVQAVSSAQFRRREYGDASQATSPQFDDVSFHIGPMQYPANTSLRNLPLPLRWSCLYDGFEFDMYGFSSHPERLLYWV